MAIVTVRYFVDFFSVNVDVPLLPAVPNIL